MARSRAWCFTLNNYNDQDESRIRDFFSPASGGRGGSSSASASADSSGEASSSDGGYFKYVCFGREVGESGTRHLQGFAYTRNPCGLQALRSRIVGAHWEIARGTPAQAIAYCQKDGDFHEWGEAPLSAHDKGQKEAARWKSARDAAVCGRLGDIDDDIFVRYYRTLKEIAKDHMGEVADADECTGVWIYGRAGIGKSRYARTEFPKAYLKMCNKWWDGYQKEEYVIIDDVDTKHDCLGHHFKIWGDRYSFLAETKGGAIKIRPKKIIVTSQYSIDQIWHDQETIDALKRRFRIVHMDGLHVLP